MSEIFRSFKLNDTSQLKCPCRHCDQRTVGCHAECPAYLAFRAEADRRIDERLKRREAEPDRHMHSKKTQKRIASMKQYKEEDR